jgi:hypothetical protein
MTETIAYIKESLRDLYPSSEVSSLVRLIMERVCNIQPHHFLFCKDKELPESEKSRIHDIVGAYPIHIRNGRFLQPSVRSRPVRPDTTSGNRRTGRAGHPRQCRPKDQDIGYRNGKRLHSRHTPEASEKSKRDCDGHFGGSARDRPPECQTQQHNGHFHPDRYPRPGESGNGHSVHSGRHRQQSALHQGGRKKRHGAERAGLRTTPGSFRPGQRPAALLLAYCPFRKEKTEKKRPSLLRNQCGMRQYGC